MSQYSHIPALACIKEPVSEPLTLSETKAYLRIDNEKDDLLINSLITAARKAAENFLCNSLIRQDWKLSYDKYAPSCILLPMGPVQLIASVNAVAIDGTATAIPASSYYLSSGNRKLIFEASLMSKLIEIIYTAGYGEEGSNVPSPIRCGMLAHIAAIYDGRSAGGIMPKQAVDFYLPYRAIRV